MTAKRISAVVATLLGAGLPVAAAVARPAYTNPTPGATLAYQIAGMHRAQVARNIVYSRPARGRRLRLDVYRPEKARKRSRLPAVLIGGPPAYGAGKDSGQKIGWAQLVAASGMAAVAFDIRSDNYLSTPADPSTDVARAIRYVRAHAAALRINANRICTLGFSLGTAPWHLWATMKNPAPYVKCNAVYYGPLDFAGFTDVPMDPKYIQGYSAITYLRQHRSRIPPMLIAKAGRDSFTGINVSIDRFKAEAVTLGADVTVVSHPRGPHGFDTANHDARSRAIIRQTLTFFSTHLRVAR